MKRNYDTIANIYDRIAGLIYGDTLQKAQVYLLKAIPAGAHILIAGGGTGKVLEQLAAIHPSGLIVTYIDSSAKMIALARERNAGGNVVTFITANIQDTALPSSYDVVLTPFLFDNFTEGTMQSVFSKMNEHLTPGGLWLNCDFQNTSFWWQRVLLRIMYLFFRIFCGIEAHRLPDIQAQFSQYGYTLKGSQTFINGFVAADIYFKP